MNIPPPTRARRARVANETSWTAADNELLTALAQSSPSPNWTNFVRFFPGRTSQQLFERWDKVLNPRLLKGAWTPREDQAITEWVTSHDPVEWTKLARTLPGRTGKQCRDRWTNMLDPKVYKGEWTETEDQILREYHSRWGNKWAKIAALLPGRTDNGVKNRWNCAFRAMVGKEEREEAKMMEGGKEREEVREMPPVIQLSPIWAHDSPFALWSPTGAISPKGMTEPMLSIDNPVSFETEPDFGQK
jgi:hypothetical protein